MSAYLLVKSVVKHGWLSEEKYQWFEKAYQTLKERTPEGDEIVAVELGVFYGMSAIAQGIICRNLKAPVLLYGVDAWEKDASLEGKNDAENDKWWSEVDYDAALASFEHAIKVFRLEDNVFPIKSKSEDAIHGFEDGTIDLLHIDGNHSEEKSCLDVDLWLPKVKSGGIIFFDDLNWHTTTKAAYKVRLQSSAILFEGDFGVYVKK